MRSERGRYGLVAPQKGSCLTIFDVAYSYWERLSKKGPIPTPFTDFDLVASQLLQVRHQSTCFKNSIESLLVESFAKNDVVSNCPMSEPCCEVPVSE